MNLGPRPLNPAARFYDHMTVAAYRARPGVSHAALDLIAVCRPTALA